MPTDQEIKDICNEYVAGKAGAQIERERGIPPGMVYYYLRKAGIKTRSRSECQRIYHHDNEYFSKIDTHEKAQFLGMIGADGNISSGTQPVFEITLEKTDAYYVEHMKKCLKYDGPLHDKYNKQFDAHSKCLFVTSRVLWDQLFALGIRPRKSLTHPFPTLDQVPDKFLCSYVLGYHEGDGCIQVLTNKKGYLRASIKICTTKEFGESLRKILKKKLNINSYLYLRKIYRKKFKNMFTLEFGGNGRVKKFCDWIYSHSSFRMTRKYEPYLELLSKLDKNGRVIKAKNWTVQLQQRAAETFKKNGTYPGRAPKKTAHFLSPDGVVHYTNRIKTFADEMDLFPGVLYNMIKGKKYYYTCHGWSIPTPAQISAARTSGTLVEKFY